MKVLVIDSDKTMRDVLIKTLAAAVVFSPLEAGDCEEGVLAASSEKPDYIFADADAVAEDTAGLIARLKAASPSARVIVVSGMGVDESVVRAALDSGASNLSKPFRAEQLKAAAGLPDDAVAGSPSASRAASSAAAGAGANIAKKILPAAALLALAVAAAFLSPRIFAARALPPAVFETEAKNISYIAFAGGKLYVTDWMEQGIYVYIAPKTADGKTLIPDRVYRKTELQPTAASVSGDTLWVADSLQGMFFRYTIGPGASAPESAGNFRAPSTAPSGVLAVRGAVWSYDTHAKKLYRHSPSDMAVAAAYDLPVEAPCGMGVMGGVFYIGDARTGRIISLSVRDMTITAVAAPEEYAAGKEKMAAFAAGGGNLWTASESGRIFRHDPSRMAGGLK